MNQPVNKWVCEYCTYENYPSTSKCTMCRASKPLLNEDIYSLRNDTNPDFTKTSVAGGITTSPNHSMRQLTTNNTNNGQWNCDACTYINLMRSKECVECKTPRSNTTTNNVICNASNLHEQLKPLKIHDSTENIPSNSTSNIITSSPMKQSKWTCGACTYENWPKAKKCIMCNTSIGNCQSQNSTPIKIITSPEHDIMQQPKTSSKENSYVSIKKSNSKRENEIPSTTTNNYEREKLRRQTDWIWLNACMGVVHGDLGPVEKYLQNGGNPTRSLTDSEVNLLNRPSAFDIGYTLIHLAVRFKQEEILGTLVASLESGGTGGPLKRVPSYVAPDLAKAIRRHAATTFAKTSRHATFPCPYITEFNTFTLPYEIEDLPVPLQEQLFDELLDKDVQQVLESEPAVINWSVEVTVHLGSRLYALWNRSQGDCLLDSIMQATWGVFDRDNLLRRALSDTLNTCAHLLYPRWVEYESYMARQLNFSLSESQWAEDWAGLVARATQPGAALQQLHVFALAHVLRRPIIVYGVKFVKSFRGEDLGYAGFEGVYLPLLWECSFCNTSPICLGYTRGHFSALVPIEPYPAGHVDDGANNIADESLQVTFLPLVDKDNKLLPIHFLNKSEMVSEERILRQWLDVNLTENSLLVAQQKYKARPLLVGQMIEEWLNHYRRIDGITKMPHHHNSGRNSSKKSLLPDFSSDGETDDE